MPRTHRRSFSIPTPDSLSSAALHYLGRYAASEESLRRLLLARLRRAEAANPDFATDHEKRAALRLHIESIILRHKTSGAINDKAFVEMKVMSLRRSGTSQRVIRQKLAQKGVSASLVSQSLEAHAQDAATDSAIGDAPDQAEWQAALTFARKRKLGPFRPVTSKIGTDAGNCSATSRKRWQAVEVREAMVFLRAGFSLALARRISGLSLEDADALELLDS